MIKIEQFDLDTIDDIAIMLLKSFKSKTVLFYGNMGVGKTTLINALLKALGSKVKATSPTFSIVNEYEVKDDIVYHFDFYRIENANEGNMIFLGSLAAITSLSSKDKLLPVLYRKLRLVSLSPITFEGFFTLIVP